MPLKLVPGRHGSPYIYLRGSIRGIRVDESTGTSRPEAAQEILIRRSAELLDRSIHGDSATRTFAQAALGYMEAGGEAKHLTPLLKALGNRKIGNIGQGELDEAARKISPHGSPSTINRQVYTPAVAVLHFAARKKWCSKPVIARPKQPAGRIRWITYDEADRLIEAAAPHLKPLVIFLLSTGARLSEALYLEWEQVDFSKPEVKFLKTKNGDDRHVPLHPHAVAALANLPWDRKGAVFRRPAGKIHKAGRVWLPYEDREGEGGGQVKTAWAGMLKRAGTKDFTPHDCRHTWATWHYAVNKDITALMTLGGWKSPEMVIRYAHVSTAVLAPSIGKLWTTPAAVAGWRGTA